MDEGKQNEKKQRYCEGIIKKVNNESFSGLPQRSADTFYRTRLVFVPGIPRQHAEVNMDLSLTFGTIPRVQQFHRIEKIISPYFVAPGKSSDSAFSYIWLLSVPLRLSQPATGRDNASE